MKVLIQYTQAGKYRDQAWEITDAKSKRRDASRDAFLCRTTDRTKQSNACNDGRRASDLPFLI